jgi:hypothetical protein
MSRTFHSVTLPDFMAVVGSYPWTREITEVHLHHTWRPRQVDYEGHATIVGMWRHHTSNNGWSDIAQHVTVAPDGTIWLGRNFNAVPASARGFNGNEQAGPFMIEMIGDFDHGKETITAAQKHSTLGVIRSVQERFRLSAGALRFHSEMSAKTCPGESFNKDALIKEIRAFELPGTDGSRARSGRTPFPEGAGRALDIIREMAAAGRLDEDMSNAEHEIGLDSIEAAARSRGSVLGQVEVTEQMKQELVGHVINLARGKFAEAQDGLGTSEVDIDRLFEETLPTEIARRKARSQKTRLLFHAHGGLVSRNQGLYIAFQHMRFWKDNGVYPLFFVWETGFASSLQQLLFGARSRVAKRRDLTDVSDEFLEEVVRALQGGRLWDVMKWSAERASDEEGGARYVAEKTAKLVGDHPTDLEVHTVGHSAGSIFNAYFMDVLVAAGGSVTTSHFLAPAIRNDLFHEKLAPHLGKKVGPLSLFTMSKRLERGDNVAEAYRKSLLYLIHEALEQDRRTPILGLEVSLRADSKAKQLFGLGGASPSGKAGVVWSPSDDEASGSASNATTHGGFDQDPPTMNSVARRVLNRLAGEDIIPFPPPARGLTADEWFGQVDWPEELADLMAGSDLAWTTDWQAPASPKPSPAAPSGGNGVTGEVATGRRLALCIGIDRYPRMPLAGCVADARLWASTLTGLGFETTMLLDEQATAEGIRTAVKNLVSSGRAGDTLVLQYAGHGTYFEDLTGDEAGGDTPAYDECLCAIDCEDTGSDGLVIDDELRAMFEELPPDIHLTVFFDSCHSGTATRMALRASAAGRARAGEPPRARYLKPSPKMEAAYQARLIQLKRGRSRARSGVQRDVLFSACTSTQQAFESNGQGDFTRRATSLLAGANGISNRDFLEQVLKAFGPGARQTPELHCDLDARTGHLLGL